MKIKILKKFFCEHEYIVWDEVTEPHNPSNRKILKVCRKCNKPILIS